MPVQGGQGSGAADLEHPPLRIRPHRGLDPTAGVGRPAQRQANPRAGLTMRADQLGVVHAVDGPALQHQHLAGGTALEQVAVLADRVEGPTVPVEAFPLLGRHGGDEFADLGVEDEPTVAQVLMQ